MKKKSESAEKKGIGDDERMTEVYVRKIFLGLKFCLLITNLTQHSDTPLYFKMGIKYGSKDGGNRKNGESPPITLLN